MCSCAKNLWFGAQNVLSFSSTAHSLNVAHLALHPYHGTLLSLDCTLHRLHDLMRFFVALSSWFLFVRNAEGLEQVTLVFLNEFSAFFAESTSKCFSIFIAASVGENGREACSRLHTIDEDSCPHIILCLLISVGACILRKWLTGHLVVRYKLIKL